MLLFDLGKLPGLQSMLIFHALARMGIEVFVTVSPKDPLVCIGYFQNTEQGVDLEYCKESKIPIMRREGEGGATYLDENQIIKSIESGYEEKGIESPGVSSKDIALTILNPVEDSEVD